MLRKSVEQSFNRIVVDGDMSTNDTVLLLTNDASGLDFTSLEDWRKFKEFQLDLDSVSTNLAQNIVCDGEGVTKFVSIHVDGTRDDEDARRIANTIATSSLVKTAFYGCDANWGRIIAAAGRAGVPFDPESAELRLSRDDNLTDALQLFANGTAASYSEHEASGIMRETEISIFLNCNLGDGSATVWTCDLSHDYVSINGDYRS
jgi:glutamate N-acetyltransferase/amino-acid N-acetyltransferase